MGNSFSSYSNIQSGGDIDDTDSSKIYESIDSVATQYILTMDFESLRKLQEKKYCEKLVELTSEIIDSRFNDLEVGQLVERVDPFLGQTQTQTKQTRCNKIAKFYIKIAHLFSAIITTINPEYMYKDATGTVIRRILSEKNKIPTDAKITVSKLNLCGERIEALEDIKEREEREEREGGEGNDGEDVSKICSINVDMREEPGIPELMDLYYDGEYEYKTGKFMGMTEETRSQYQSDLKRFYTGFTGNENIPDDISKFSDIKMRDYSKKPFCSVGGSNKYKNNLFLEYANNLKKMIQTVNTNQEKLLNIINKIFVHVIDPITQEEIIRINPDLNEVELQEIIVDTRKIIIELYLNCESDFVEGVKMYEAIVESRILETTQKQIYSLQKEAEKLQEK